MSRWLGSETEEKTGCVKTSALPRSTVASRRGPNMEQRRGLLSLYFSTFVGGGRRGSAHWQGPDWLPDSERTRIVSVWSLVITPRGNFLLQPDNGSEYRPNGFWYGLRGGGGCSRSFLHMNWCHRVIVALVKLWTFTGNVVYLLCFFKKIFIYAGWNCKTKCIYQKHTLY